MIERLGILTERQIRLGRFAANRIVTRLKPQHFFVKDGDARQLLSTGGALALPFGELDHRRDVIGMKLQVLPGQLDRRLGPAFFAIFVGLPEQRLGNAPRLEGVEPPSSGGSHEQNAKQACGKRPIDPAHRRRLVGRANQETVGSWRCAVGRNSHCTLPTAHCTPITNGGAA